MSAPAPRHRDGFGRDLAWLLVVAFILTVLGVTGTVMIVNGAARGFGL